jgi:hypothetical protein
METTPLRFTNPVELPNLSFVEIVVRRTVGREIEDDG